MEWPPDEAEDLKSWQIIDHDQVGAPATPGHKEATQQASKGDELASDESLAARKSQQVAHKEPCCGEVLTAKVVYCILCLLDAAVKMSEAAKQVATRTCVAGNLLLNKAELAAAPSLHAARATAQQYCDLLRQHDVRAVRMLAKSHASNAGAWLVDVLGPALASAHQAACSTARTAIPSATAAMRQLQNCGQQRRRCLLASVRSSGCCCCRWLRNRHTRLDPAGRLHAAARTACMRACQVPPVVLLAAGGAGVLGMGLLLLLFAA